MGRTEERYVVRLLGKFDEGVDKEQAIGSLSKRFRVPAAQFRKFFSGTPRIVKRNVGLAQAKQCAAVFKKAGAPCEIDIDFSPGFFKDSLYEVMVQTDPGNSAAQSESEAFPAKPETAAPSLRPEAGNQAANPLPGAILGSETRAESASEPESRIIRFERYFITPLICSFPYSIALTDDNNAAIGAVESDKIAMGWFLSLFLAVFLVRESFDRVLEFTLVNSLSSPVFTVLNIVGFLTFLLCLPKFMRPRKKVTLLSGTPGKADVFCRVEEKWLSPISKRTFRVKDGRGKTIAVIRKSLLFSVFTCKLPDGRTAFSVDKNKDLDIDHTAMGVAGTIRDGLMDLGYVGDLIWSKLDPDLDPKTWAVRNDKDEKVGAFQLGRTCRLRARVRNNEEDRIVQAFAMVLAGL